MNAENVMEIKDKYTMRSQHVESRISYKFIFLPKDHHRMKVNALDKQNHFNLFSKPVHNSLFNAIFGSGKKLC